jgi:hypothetical protein
MRASAAAEPPNPSKELSTDLDLIWILFGMASGSSSYKPIPSDSSAYPYFKAGGFPWAAPGNLLASKKTRKIISEKLLHSDKK